MNYPSEVLLDRPTLYWRLGETTGNLPQDSSGNGRHATVSNDPTEGAASLIATEPTDKACSFDLNDTVSIPDDVALDVLGNGDATVEAWIKSSQVGGARVQTIVGKKNEWALQVGWVIAFDAADNLVVRVATTTDRLSVAGAGWLDGNPHQIAWVRYASLDEDRLYVDGVLQQMTTSGAPTDDLSNSQPMKVGKINGTDSDALIGTIDEVAFYGSALSGARIAEHYAASLVKPAGTAHIVREPARRRLQAAFPR